jgi:Predicted permease
MNSLFDKPFTFDRVFRIIFGILTVVGLVYLITVLRTALLPFLIAWLMAYIMQPLVKFYQYRMRLKSRILAIIAVLITIALILTLAIMIFIPSISAEVERTMLLLRTYNTGHSVIPFVPEEWLLYIQDQINFIELKDSFSKENVLNVVKQIAPRVWNILSGTLSVLVSTAIIFIIFLYFVFILLDYERIASGWKRLIPKSYRPFAEGLVSDVEVSMQRYFRGQSLIALCVGIMFAIGFQIIGLPLGITLGLFMGLLNLIPYLQTIGIIPMTLLCLLKSAETGENFWVILVSAVLVLVIVQVIQDLFLTPKIMGKQMGLNPAIILLSLSIWGTLLGFIGLIIALPLTTLCLSYYKRFIITEDDFKSKPPTKEQEEKILTVGDQ